MGGGESEGKPQVEDHKKRNERTSKFLSSGGFKGVVSKPVLLDPQLF